MKRILQILGIGGITFFLIFWISSISKGCNPNKNATNTEQTAQVTDSTANEDIDLGEDIFEEGETNNSEAPNNANNSSTTKGDENIDDFIDYSGDVKAETKKTKSTASTNHSVAKKSKEPKQTYSTSSTGSYLVVAGSYLVKSNAIKMKKRLSRLGYNSEIVNFDLSQYYSVLAGRFSSRSGARETVSILKRNNIDSYVHRKK